MCIPLSLLDGTDEDSVLSDDVSVDTLTTPEGYDSEVENMSSEKVESEESFVRLDREENSESEDTDVSADLCESYNEANESSGASLRRKDGSAYFNECLGIGRIVAIVGFSIWLCRNNTN